MSSSSDETDVEVDVVGNDDCSGNEQLPFSEPSLRSDSVIRDAPCKPTFFGIREGLSQIGFRGGLGGFRPPSLNAPARPALLRDDISSRPTNYVQSYRPPPYAPGFFNRHRTGFVNPAVPCEGTYIRIPEPRTQLGFQSDVGGFRSPNVSAPFRPASLREYSPIVANNLQSLRQPAYESFPSNSHRPDLQTPPAACLPTYIRIREPCRQFGFQGHVYGFRSPSVNAPFRRALLREFPARLTENFESLRLRANEPNPLIRDRTDVLTAPVPRVPTYIRNREPSTEFVFEENVCALRLPSLNAPFRPAMLREFPGRLPDNFQGLRQPASEFPLFNRHRTADFVNPAGPCQPTLSGIPEARRQFDFHTGLGGFRSPILNASLVPVFQRQNTPTPLHYVQSYRSPAYVPVSTNPYISGEGPVARQSTVAGLRSTRYISTVDPHSPEQTTRMLGTLTEEAVCSEKGTDKVTTGRRPQSDMAVTEEPPLYQKIAGLIERVPAVEPEKHRYVRESAICQSTSIDRFPDRSTLSKNVGYGKSGDLDSQNYLDGDSALLQLPTSGEEHAAVTCIGLARNLPQQCQLANSFAEATAVFLENVSFSVPGQRKEVVSQTSSSDMSGVSVATTARKQIKNLKEQRTGAPKRAHVRRKKSLSAVASQRQGCNSQSSSSAVLESPKKFKRGRPKGAKTRSSTCNESSNQSAVSENGNEGICGPDSARLSQSPELPEKSKPGPSKGTKYKPRTRIEISPQSAAFANDHDWYCVPGLQDLRQSAQLPKKTKPGPPKGTKYKRRPRKNNSSQSEACANESEGCRIPDLPTTSPSSSLLPKTKSQTANLTTSFSRKKKSTNSEGGVRRARKQQEPSFCDQSVDVQEPQIVGAAADLVPGLRANCRSAVSETPKKAKRTHRKSANTRRSTLSQSSSQSRESANDKEVFRIPDLPTTTENSELPKTANRSRPKGARNNPKGANKESSQSTVSAIDNVGIHVPVVEAIPGPSGFPRKLNRGRPKGAKNKRCSNDNNSPLSAASLNEQDGFRTTSPSSSRLPKSKSQTGNSVTGSSRKKKSTNSEGAAGRAKQQREPSFRGRPIVEPEPESTETAPDHAPGSLAKFLSVVKWARRHVVTPTGFYTITENHTKCKIHKVEENSVGSMSKVCSECSAKYFPKEKPGGGVYKKCCKEGVVKMPPPPAYPEVLKKLFLADDPLSLDFRRNIRQYNNACAFAAFTHNSVALSGRGPKTYSVHGQSYHRVGSVNAVPGRIPQYAQLYVLDSAMALQAREDLPYNKSCRKEVFEIIDRVIRECNPVCKVLMNMRECQRRLEENMENTTSGNENAMNSRPANVKMYIGNNARMNIRQYAPPTTSEEISVVVPEDSSNKKPERYVTIFWRNNSLQHIHFANPLLDTLIYPLLFVHGEYGYSINLFSWEANKGAPSQLKPTRQGTFPAPSSSSGIPKGPTVGLSSNKPNGNGNEQIVDIDTEFVDAEFATQNSSVTDTPVNTANPTTSSGVGMTKAPRVGLSSNESDCSRNEECDNIRVESDDTDAGARIAADEDIPANTTSRSNIDETIEDVVSGAGCPFEPMDEGELELDDDNHIIVPERLRENPRKVSMMNFYAHMLHVRVGNEDTNFSPLHHSRKLFQQYLCDVFVRVEEERLGYIRREQERLRVANYLDLHKQVNDIAGKRNLPAGTIVILPSSFTNGQRNMVNHYRDAMAIVGKHGKPDYFITFTCNPKWEEITRHLFPGQTAVDRPDLVARVFELKAKEFKQELVKKKPFGRVRAMTSAIEYQKRGLPHMHLLLIVDNDAKPNTAEKVDTIVSAEIPCPVRHPKLHEMVMTHMIHGPCGAENIYSPCMFNNSCTKDYPKAFNDGTVIDAATYPKYRRTKNIEDSVVVGNRHVHNGWVIPYNPYLLMKFNAHINVEICSSLKSVKYLYKYVHKGHDQVRVVCAETGRPVDVDDIHKETTGNANPGCNANEEAPGPSNQPRLQVSIDEIEKHIRGRYVSAPEAVGRLLEFKSTSSSHTVHRLPVHLPGNQSVMYADGMEEEALQAQEGRHTQLTAWFELNKKDANARSLRYTQIPTLYVWNKKSKENPEKSFTWTERRANWSIIPRLHNVPTHDMELFSLRVLLLHVTGCQSFEDIRTLPDGTVTETFLQAAVSRGLLDDDKCWDETMEEGVAFKMPSALRNLFAMILCHGQVVDPLKLWEKYKEHLIEDFVFQEYSEQDAESLALRDIGDVIVMNNKHPKDFKLPRPSRVSHRRVMETGFVAEDEKEAATYRISKLNSGQSNAIKRILLALKKYDDDFEIPESLRCSDDECNEEVNNKLFYLDGPGGTGKTFVYNTIMSIIRSQHGSVLAVAPTGIAATLLPGGRTVHSRFGVPIDLKPNSTSTVKPNSENADQLRKAKIIIWDEISMTHKNVMSVVDRLMQDLMQNTLPFGGKVVVVGGDFRQQLPVVKGGGENEIIVNSVVYNHRWREFKKLQLTQNMRTDDESKEFADWLLELGDGKIPPAEEAFAEINLPDDLVLKKTEEYTSMVDYIYGNKLDPKDANEHIKKAILCPLNEDTFRVNANVLNRLDGIMVTYKSADKALPLSGDPFDETEFPMELMNKTTPSGMPHHELNLKKGAIIMLLRNLNPKLGMVNGTRMVVTDCKVNAKVIQAQFLTGIHKDKYVLIPRISLCPTEQQTELPVRLRRTQFPVRLAYSMTINKSQGQTLERVGIILSMPVFSHGMLYTAFSRVTSRKNVRVQVGPELLLNPCTKTMNVVYKDIFDYRDGLV